MRNWLLKNWQNRKLCSMKYKNIKVKRKPFIWCFIPFLRSYTAQAIYPNIYVVKEAFESLSSKDPNPRYIASLEHELTHIQRQKEIRFFKWGVKDILSPQFRLQEELLAMRETMRYLKKRKLKFDFDRSARFLSSYLYFRMASYKQVKKKLEEIWDQLSNT